MKTSIGTSAGRPAARIRSASPVRRKISIVRALQRSILGRNSGAAFCSTSRQPTPRCPRSTASVSPTGPAPTTTTSVCPAAPSAMSAQPIKCPATDVDYATLVRPFAVAEPLEDTMIHRSIVAWTLGLLAAARLAGAQTPPELLAYPTLVLYNGKVL